MKQAVSLRAGHEHHLSSIQAQHQQLDERLRELGRRPFLTPKEQLEVAESDANSSGGVVRKSNHHHGRGIALMIVPGVSCGGMEKPLRLSRRRALATGTSTVTSSVS